MTIKLHTPTLYAIDALSVFTGCHGQHLDTIKGMFAACQREAIEACRAIALDNARSLTGTGQGMAADIAEEINALALAVAP